MRRISALLFLTVLVGFVDWADAFIQSLFPPGLQGAVSLVSSLLTSENLSPECKDLMRTCLLPGTLRCEEEIADCAMEAVVGPNPAAKISDIGDVDVHRIVEDLAREATLDPNMLLKVILRECKRYLPPQWSSLLTQMGGAEKPEGPQDAFICSLLTDRNVGVYYDDFRLSGGCDVGSVRHECARQPIMPLRDVFGVYLNYVYGVLPFEPYYPGSVRSLQGVLRMQPTNTVTGCLRADRRTPCLAAAILADACERSCVAGNCVWDQYRHDCVQTGQKDFFRAAGRKCESLATAMRAGGAPQCIRGAATAHSITVAMACIGTLFMLFT